MKPLFSLLIALAIFSNAFATPLPKLSPTATLYHYFPVAKEIVWTSINSYQKATFYIGGSVYNAFFDNDGELVATTQSISLTDLPKGLQASLKEELKAYWISDLIVMSTKEGERYYVQLEFAGSKIIKQASGNKWTTYKIL